MKLDTVRSNSSSPWPREARFVFAAGSAVFAVGMVLMNRSMLGCSIALLASGPIIASAAIPRQGSVYRVLSVVLGIAILSMGAAALWAAEHYQQI